MNRLVAAFCLLAQCCISHGQIRSDGTLYGAFGVANGRQIPNHVVSFLEKSGVKLYISTRVAYPCGPSGAYVDASKALELLPYWKSHVAPYVIQPGGEVLEDEIRCKSAAASTEEHAAIVAEYQKKSDDIESARKEAASPDSVANKQALNEYVKSSIPSLVTLDLCVRYGQLERDDASFLAWPVRSKDLVGPFRNELKKRRLALNASTVRKQEVMIGMNLCQMLASLGVPDHANRTIGRFGTHIQHVYGSLLVYTENGTVTAIQD